MPKRRHICRLPCIRELACHETGNHLTSADDRRRRDQKIAKIISLPVTVTSVAVHHHALAAYFVDETITANRRPPNGDTLVQSRDITLGA